MLNEIEELLNEVELFWQFYHMTVETSSNLDDLPEQYVPAHRIFETPNGSVDDLLATVNHRLITAKDPEAELQTLSEDLEALCDALNLFRADFIRLKWSSYAYFEDAQGALKAREGSKRYIFAPAKAQVLPWVEDCDAA